MAILHIPAPDGKTLNIDVGNDDPSTYDATIDETLAQYVADQNPTPGAALMDSLKQIGGAVKTIGQTTKAGIGGFADLVSGNGLPQAASDVNAIEQDQKPGTTAAKVGSALGNAVTPENLALQAATAGVADIIGPWAADFIKGWGEQAARFAVGIVGKIAKAIGSKYLPAIAEFLLSDVKVGEQTFPAILDATSSVSTMQAKAGAIKNAAIAALNKIGPQADAALAENPSLINLKQLIMDLKALPANLQKYLPDVASTVIDTFEGATEDFIQTINNARTAENPKLFSAIRDFRIALDDFIGNFNSKSPLKIAFIRIRGVIADALEDTAENIDPDLGAALTEANSVYNKVMAVINGLEGKATTGFFNDPFSSVMAMASSLTSLGAGHGMFAAPAAAAGFAAGKVAQSYAPQAIAAGLTALPPIINAVTPYVAPAVNAAATIYQGLKQ